MKFTSLDLAPQLLRALEECGYKTLTPIQEKAIVQARRGRDVLAIAQTGTGKTAAFAIPILQRLSDKGRETQASMPQALILTPTRELTEQLADTISAYAQYLDIAIVGAYGGGKMSSQIAKIKNGVDVLIATPGRLMELLADNAVALSQVEYLVLDESDRMLDMGFINDVQALINRTKGTRQTMLFSATLSPAVNELSHKILKNHEEIRVNAVNTAADTVSQVVYAVEERRKIDLFKDLFEQNNWYQVLVFTSTKHQADRLYKLLKEMKVTVGICHGDKRQNARRRAIAEFKAGDTQVLIATEVAARGLDIQGLDIVVNYNLPYLAEDYVHRIGRTGRAGNSGQAISLVSREEERALDAIQRLIKSKIKRIHRHGFEASDRDQLIRKVEQQKKSSKSNKPSSTYIKRKK